MKNQSLASGLSCLLVITLFFFWTGCTKPPSPHHPDMLPPGEKEFFLAEKAYTDARSEDAIKAYKDFLKQYPDHKHTPSALFKLGTLHAAQGEGSKARYYFEKLTQGFPGNSLVPEALLAQCSSFYAENLPEKTLGCIQSIHDRIHTEESRTRLAFLQADTLSELKRMPEALETLVMAFDTAPESLHPLLVEKIFSQTRSMEAGDLEALFDRAGQPEPRAILIFASAIRLAETGRYRAAEDRLLFFLETFPRHPRKNMAKDLKKSLKDKEEIDPLAIGCLLPLSGRFEAFGMQALRGVEMAMAVYTSREDALPVRILIEDTRSDETATANAIRLLDERKIIAAIGPLAASPESIQVAADHGLPLITLTQQEGITDIGPLIFRNFMTPSMQVRALVYHAMNRQNLFRFGILHPDDSYGQNFRDLFWDTVEDMGGRITGVEAYPPRSTDFSEPIRRLTGLHLPIPEDLSSSETEKDEKSSGPAIQFDALFIPDSAQRAGMILPQLAYNDLVGVRLLGTNLWHSPRLIEMAGHHARGAILPTGFFAESQNPRVQEFTSLFLETYGDPPGYLEAVIFDSLMVLFHTLEQKPYSRHELAEFIQKTKTYQGVTGPVGFAENRESLTPPFILEIRGSSFREIKP